ncbi:MAG: N-6 DNA methylase, partial [bacterium]
HPGSSLMSWKPPDIAEIMDIYSYLLDSEPRLAESDVVVLNNGKRVLDVREAHPGDIRRGRIIKKGNVVYEMVKGKSRKSGTVYTPDEIVNKIVERTLGPLNENPLRVLDPSCGTGRFLSGALDYLIEQKKRGSVEEIRKIISDSIFGVDQDRIAVELAEVHLMLRTHRLDNPAPELKSNLFVGDTLKGVDSYFIRGLLQSDGDVEKAIDDRPQTTFDEIRWKPVWQHLLNCENRNEKANELASIYDLFIDYLNNENADFKELKMDFQRKLVNFPNSASNHDYRDIENFHQEVNFPFLFYGLNGDVLPDGGFDAVIGNPPYGDILDAESKKLIQKLGYKSGGGGNNDIFRFFVERGLKLLKKGGMLGFILPNTYLKGKKYRNFRKRVVEMSCPEEILDFNHKKVFQRDVFTSLLFLRKKPAHNIQPVFYTSSDGTLENLKKEKFSPGNGVEDSWLPKGKIYERFCDDRCYQPLEPYFAKIGDVGINYQRRQVGWSDRKKSRIADEIFYEGERENPDDLLYLKGEDIERFLVKPRLRRWLRHDWKERMTEGEVVNVNYNWAYRPVKILSRQTGDSIIAAIDQNNFLTGRSLHTTLIRDLAYSPWYLVAVMNSEIVTKIYRELTREKGRPQAQVKLSFLRMLPIRRIDFVLGEDERKYVFEELKSRVVQNPEKLVSMVCESVSDNREDIAHDLIAFSAMSLEGQLKQNGDNGSSDGAELLRESLDKAVGVLYGKGV